MAAVRRRPVAHRDGVGLVTHDDTSLRLDVHIEPWGRLDLPLLERLNEPDMTKHVGGPETSDKVVERQRGYEMPGSRQYAIVEPGGEHIGWVGYWERTWHDQDVWETGWAVIPSFQGRGAASTAMGQLLGLARAERLHRFAHAYPMTVNAPSNAICRKLGFELLGEIDFPARRGGVVRCNDWRIDLFGGEPEG
jgi:RimJ/RimL family protein N-acetyltransferase